MSDEFDNDKNWKEAGYTVSIAEYQDQDPYDRIPEIAKRLGVEPLTGSWTRPLVVRTKEGQSYDVYELVTAFLDRIDRIVA